MEKVYIGIQMILGMEVSKISLKTKLKAFLLGGVSII
jgi:hypothetical protein